MATTAAQYELIVSTQGTSEVAALQAQVQKFTSQMQTAQKQASGFGSSLSGSARAGIQNFSFQIQDLAVQMASGTSATRAFSQQLPQLLSGFGLFGALAGTAAAVLIPLAGSVLNLGGSLKTVAEQSKETADAFERMASSQAALKTSASELGEKYGVFAEQVRNANAAVAELDKREALKSLQSSVDAIVKSFETVTYEAQGAGVALDEIASAGNAVAVTDTIGGLAQKLGLSKEEATRLAEALKGVRTNSDLSTSIPVLSEFIARLSQGSPVAQQLGRDLAEVVKQASTLNAIRSQSSSGFSFTPYVNPSPDYEGTEKVRQQLQKMEEAQKALTRSQEEAVRAARALDTEFNSFTTTIERGTTPLQQISAQLQEAEANLAKFQSRMSAEQIEQANAYLDGLRLKLDDIAFKERWDEMAAGVASATEALTPFHEQLQTIWQGIQDSFVNGITDAFTSFIEGTASAEEAFKSFAASFLKQIAAMIVKALALYAIQTALGGLGFGVSPSQAGGGIFNGIFGRNALAPAGGGGITPFSGGVSGGDTLIAGRVIPSRAAITPLASGTSTVQPMQVTVNNYAGADVRTKETADGRLQIDIIKKELAADFARGGNVLARSIEQGYGLRRAGR